MAVKPYYNCEIKSEKSDENEIGDVSNLYGFENINPTVGPDKLYMGLHYINDSWLIKIQEDLNKTRKQGSKVRQFNVKMNQDYTLEVTSDTIKKGHKLLMKYFKKPVYKLIKKVSKK